MNLEKKEMKCQECKYSFEGDICKITYRCCVTSCDYITNDNEVENMLICYNCKYWLGGGDWGLSCSKNYYKCSSNGFDKACKEFERE